MAGRHLSALPRAQDRNRLMRSIASYGNGFFLNKTLDYQGNVHLALSGGRSSGALLRMCLDFFGGGLPPNWQVVFTNTGAEHEETLVFVQKMSDQWKVDIAWIELADILPDHRSVLYKSVDFSSASRKGEPWHILREAKPSFPPRRSARICTLYMKIYPARAYLAALGWADWTI